MEKIEGEARRGSWLDARGLTVAMLVVYLAALVWIILFKMQFGPDVFGTMRSVNLVPFAGALVVNGTANYGEVVENLLAFVPFGLLIAMLEPQRSFAAKLAPIAGTSLALEVLQFVFAAGASDITDLLSNTLGGAIGLGLYALVRLLTSSDARALRVCNGVALAGTVAVLALIGLLVGANW